MAQQLERTLASFGAGLCLHLPGCCPAGSICSMATTTAPPLSPPSLPKAPLGLCDGTELLAREILCLAQRELAEQQERPELAGTPEGVNAKSATARYPQSTVLEQSMKGSLRRFLEKRAARLRQASVSPYSTAEKLHSTCPP